MTVDVRRVALRRTPPVGDAVIVLVENGRSSGKIRLERTGRFKKASGTLTFTETIVPVLPTLRAVPSFFTSTGSFTGMVSGAATAAVSQDDRKARAIGNAYRAFGRPDCRSGCL